MREQVLDSMELEREKGITIKMQPVRMNYKKEEGGESYVLNMIDTPGHIDFSYEVSRALKAVEGSLLLVDATQGVQAQTLTTLSHAQNEGLTLIPVISKIDSPLARIEETKEEIVNLLGCKREDIIETSGKTGEGVPHLLEAIVSRIPSPHTREESTFLGFRALVFDFQYSNHQGVILYVRVLSGSVKKRDGLSLLKAHEKFQALEVGVFAPEPKEVLSLGEGEIGYIVTGIKRPGIASVGDTVGGERLKESDALLGYMNPKAVIWASIYPESQDDLVLLRQSLERLRLSDASLSFEEEQSGSLGRGFRCGFLGMLHLEIITERLKREFDLNLIVTTPSITYEVEMKNGKRVKIFTPSLFPDSGLVQKVYEPWVRAKIIAPSKYLQNIMPALFSYEAIPGDTDVRGDRVSLEITMPLRELMRNFFDELKSLSSGFASLSYEIEALRPAEVTRLDIYVAEEPVVAFSKVVPISKAQEEAERSVERLYHILPKQLFTVKIQAKALGRILSSRTITALKKSLGDFGKNGGDVTRKMKLWAKQKKGKEKLQERGVVNIPQDVFIKMIRRDGA